MQDCKWCGDPYDNYAVQPWGARAGYCSVRCTTEVTNHEENQGSGRRLMAGAALASIAIAATSRQSTPLSHVERGRREAVIMAFPLGFFVWLIGSFAFGFASKLIFGPNLFIFLTGGFISSIGLLCYAHEQGNDRLSAIAKAALIVAVVVTILCMI